MERAAKRLYAVGMSVYAYTFFLIVSGFAFLTWCVSTVGLGVMRLRYHRLPPRMVVLVLGSAAVCPVAYGIAALLR